MKKLINYCINEDQTIKETIPIVQGNVVRCAIVLDKKGKVVGVFSEGDVLRAVLKGISLYKPLREAINPTFHYLNEVDMKKAYKMIKKFRITSIPIIDKNNKPKDIVTIFDVLEYLSLKESKA